MMFGDVYQDPQETYLQRAKKLKYNKRKLK